MTQEITTPLVNIDFPKILPPEELEKGTKWSALLWFSKEETGFVKELEALVQEVLAEKYAGVNPKKIKHPKLIDGDEHSYVNADDEEIYPREGQWGFNCASFRKPKIMDLYKEDITDPKDLGWGMTGQFKINGYPWKYNGKLGINWGIGQTIMIRHKGEKGSSTPTGDPTDGFDLTPEAA
jgi:hypothetical protein